MYTTPFVYDSLFPYPIVSDTIDLDCGVIVHVPEPEKQPEAFEMKVFPNPAMGKVTVRLYLFRLVFRGGAVGDVKVVVE